MKYVLVALISINMFDSHFDSTYFLCLSDMLLVFFWKNEKKFECSKYSGSPEVHGRKLELFLFFFFLHLVLSAIRLS